MNQPGCPHIIGVIGGSGLYEVDGLTDIREETVNTPFGAPSDSFIIGSLKGQTIVCLPRHGRGHKQSPTSLNFRANIDAMKWLAEQGSSTRRFRHRRPVH